MKKMTNEEFIELCLERLSMGKTSDVVNFSYADTLAYIRRLKAENAKLRKRLEQAVELPCAPEHIDIGLSMIQASLFDETYRLCVPVYIYFRAKDKEQAVAWLQQIKENVK